ncbi:MAG TPA: ABC transporter permease, partial [Tepidiformaceae bacterium]|nr:ABC transporter permease [Tepidiformaceae bacterium]
MSASEQSAAQTFDFAAHDLHTTQRSLWSDAFQRLIRNRLALGSAILLTCIITASIAAEYIPAVANHPPAQPHFADRDSMPSTEYWLGTDKLGRDLWARLMQGTLFSLKIGFGTQLIILTIGITVGMGAALAGRLSDTILMWLTDLAYAFPDLLAIILLRQILFGRDWPIIGSGSPQIPGANGVLLVTVFAIAFVSWTTVARLVRGQMLSLKETDYITAARSIGAVDRRQGGAAKG